MSENLNFDWPPASGNEFQATPTLNYFPSASGTLIRKIDAFGSCATIRYILGLTRPNLVTFWLLLIRYIGGRSVFLSPWYLHGFEPLWHVEENHTQTKNGETENKLAKHKNISNWSSFSFYFCSIKLALCRKPWLNHNKNVTVRPASLWILK